MSDDTWVTRTPRPEGDYAYVHLIRSPDDPKRSSRPKGGRVDRAPHLTLARTSSEDWEAQILALLKDGTPRTFNEIGVELLDKTADVLACTPVDDALWGLVARGELEHTLDAPVLFRSIVPVDGGAGGATQHT